MPKIVAPGFDPQVVDAGRAERAPQRVGLLPRAPGPRFADTRVGRYSVDVENFESIHNHSAYARIER